MDNPSRQDGVDPQANNARVLNYTRPRRTTSADDDIDAPPIPNPAARISLRCILMLVVLFILCICLGICSPILGLTIRRFLYWLLALACLAATTSAAIFGVIGICRASVPGVAGRTQAVIGLILGILGLTGVVSSILLEQTYGPNGFYTRSRCASNLRMIGLACALYAKDNGGRYPIRIEQLITDCDLDAPSFLCPASSDTEASGASTAERAADLAQPGHCSYVWVGSNLTTASPATAVLAYEPLGNHDGYGIHVLYADGTVAWLDPRSARKLIAGLQPSTSRPTSP